MSAETVSMVTLDGEDFVASLEDLAALADVVGARANALSLIPEGAGRKERATAALQTLEPAAQARLAVALGVLRAPGKMAHLHQSIADESVGRAALAWSSSVPEAIVGLAGSADPRCIRFWSPATLEASIRKTLAADDALRDDEIGCKLSTPAVVVFLAALDQLRAARLHSMLTHTAPSPYFSQGELMARLADAANEDFRWPLLFVEKLIPGRLVTSLTEAEVAAAIGETERAGLVEKVSEGSTPRYELTEAGKIVADGVLHDVSKVAIGVTDQQGDGRFGRDILLLVRSSFHLFLFAMAGQDGVIAAVANDELAAALHLALRPPTPPEIVEEAPAAPPPAPPAPVKQWYFSRDGKTEGPLEEAALRALLATLPAETQVWNQDLPSWMSAREAGFAPPPAPAPSNVCPGCGAPGVPGQRFCMSCGRPRV